ncbi:putative FAS1 domain-containing protein [Helianthus annuus]|nr:putative FAS1 domain-containing protein [Helianthus annuus]
MASTFIPSIFLLLITAINTVAVTAVPEHEYSSLLSALRNRGYHVFANAITTTDLYYDIISGGNFTFFAPIDSVLFTLDMSMSAADYTSTMRLHVVPHRLSFSDLRNLPYGLNSFSTLLPDHQIHVVNPMPLPLPIIVEGVYIAVPDLYTDVHVVVHGLESIIDFRSKNDTVNSTSIGENLAPDLAPTDVHRESYPPSPEVAVPVNALAPKSSVVTGIDTVASPVPVPQKSYVPFLSVPQPETRSESIIQSIQSPEPKSESIIQSNQSPEPKSESVIQSNQSPATKSESIVQSIQSPKPKSESVIQSQLSPEEKSESIVQTHQSPKSYFESITQPIEEHASIASRSRFIPQAIHHVSLAKKSIAAVEEFTPVDETIIDCPVTDDEREPLSIANIRRRDKYMRELYNPTEMTCAHE